MSNNDRPERPRQEPEIIPPGRDSRAQGDISAVWIGVNERDGVRRVYLKRPGPFSIFLAFLTVGLIAAVILALLAGLVLIWIPLVAAVIFVGLMGLSLRYHWRRLQGWWANRR
jgi:fatty acid desaturase